MFFFSELFTKPLPEKGGRGAGLEEGGGKKSSFKGAGGGGGGSKQFFKHHSKTAAIFSPLFHLVLNMFVSGKQPTLDGISHHPRHQCLPALMCIMFKHAT